MKNAHPASISFHVGDRVQFPFGSGLVTADIVEDMGAVGVNGRRLFRVSIPMDPDEPYLGVMAEDEMEPAPEVDNRAAMTKEKILTYLKNAGLRRMLRIFTLRGEYQPRVWVCFDHHGNVTHTFAKARGLVGGGTAPYGTLRFDRILKSKVPEVVEFLEHFGLTKKEAEQVIRDNGTTK